MNQEFLNIKSVTKSFDGLKAVDDFTCDIQQGELVGLIGANGAGKTTLFNVLTGFHKTENGFVHFLGKEMSGKSPDKISLKGISRTFQDLRLITQMTLLENVMLWTTGNPGESVFNIFFKNKSIKQFEKESRDKAVSLLEFSGLSDKANDKAGDLSYGQQKLLSFACCLASNPKLILLDEPVSGIQPRMIEKITEMIFDLKKKGKTIFFIEHDMEFVFKVAERVIVMDHGKKIADDKPAAIKDNKEILESYLI